MVNQKDTDSEICKPTKGLGIGDYKQIDIDNVPLFKKRWGGDNKAAKDVKDVNTPLKSWADVAPDYWKKQLEERAKKVLEHGQIRSVEERRKHTKEELEDNESTAECFKQHKSPPDLYFIGDEETFLPEDDINEPSLESLLFCEGARVEDYKIGEQIGSGGMGGIFSIDKHNSGKYILKIPLRLGSQKTALENEITALKYVWNEVRRGIATGILFAEPNIIKLHASSQGYLTWAILELLESQLNRKKPLTDTVVKRPVFVAKKDTICGQQPGRVARYILDAAQTLEFLHSLNVVHGDIKYQNCMETHRDGNLEFILFDFGLAKILNEANERRIRKIERFGMTIQYVTRSYLNEMMMEWDGKFYQKCPLPKMKLILKRSDWEALALSAYELLTGVSPYSYTKKPRKQNGYECPLDNSSNYVRVKTILAWKDSPIDYDLVRKCPHGDTFVKVFQLLQDPFILSKDNINRVHSLLGREVLGI